MTLKVKTLGDANPKGMPKVYYCCHAEDFSPYFPRISKEILNISDCAIYWYEGDPGEEWELELGQMQLFVMPVTRLLLTTANRALDVEFRFALERHIPVLPLMQESGLEALFNEKCGDLQFLDRNVRDITAITYEQKLKRYLESVLIGDEMAQKIRGTFDAYIFLSYRKKDRKQAQELMRLIHKNDFCRDIAIWYDEFLTPGHNFNDSIRDALDKSQIFALAVTPNLINEENYVMTTEYPMARDANKPILPAMLQDTDENILREKYPGIPNCVDAHQESALNQALLRMIQSFAIQENDDDPQHNYFIGLAYLGGIDVEVDHERAVKLITSAAEAGVPEAMIKLVSMYRYGEGVTRDLEKAIMWSSELTKKYEVSFRASGSVDAACVWLNSLLALCELLHLAKKYPEALTLSKKIIAYSKRMYHPTVFSWQGRLLRRNVSRFPYALHIRGLTYIQRGYVFSALVKSGIRGSGWGNSFKAESSFYFAHDAWIDYLDDETPTNEVRIGMAVAYVGIGNVQLLSAQCLSTYSAHDLKYAEEYYSEALELLKKISDEDTNVEVVKLFSECYRNLCEICFEEGCFTEAEVYGQNAYSMEMKLAELDKGVDSQLRLANAHILLGQVLLAQHRYSEAEEYLSTAYKLLYEEDMPLGEECLRLRIIVNKCLGDYSVTYGLVESAIWYYECACSIDGGVNPISKRWINDCHDALREIYGIQGNFMMEKKHYEARWPQSPKGQAKSSISTLLLTALYEVLNTLNWYYKGLNKQFNYESIRGKLIRIDRLSKRKRTSNVMSYLRNCVEELILWSDIAMKEDILRAEKTNLDKRLSVLRHSLYYHALMSQKHEAQCLLEMSRMVEKLLLKYYPK